MAMVIERLSGTSYETYPRDRVLTPAGAAGARFGDAWDILPGRAELYTAVDITPDHGKLLARAGRPVLADRIRRYGSKAFPDFMWPAAGLNASLDELINLELAPGSGRIISPELLAQMAEPPQLPDGRAGVFGLGFIVGRLDGHKTLAYGGGAATWRLSSPEQDLTVIVLTNLQGCYPDRLAADVIKLAAIIP